MKLSAAFTCKPASKSGASISYTEWFPLLIIVLLARICVTAFVVNLKDVTTKWEDLLLLDFGFFFFPSIMSTDSSCSLLSVYWE